MSKVSVGDLVTLKVHLDDRWLSCSIGEAEFVENYNNRIALVTEVLDDKELHVELEPVKPGHDGSHSNQSKVGAYVHQSMVELVFTT